MITGCTPVYLSGHVALSRALCHCTNPRKSKRSDPRSQAQNQEKHRLNYRMPVGRQWCVSVCTSLVSKALGSIANPPFSELPNRIQPSCWRSFLYPCPSPFWPDEQLKRGLFFNLPATKPQTVNRPIRMATNQIPKGESGGMRQNMKGVDTWSMGPGDKASVASASLEHVARGSPSCNARCVEP